MKESFYKNSKADTTLYSLISEYRTGIMGVSMFCIILFHQYFTSVFPFNIFHNFGYWGVDVFLFLSGMGLVNSLRKNTINKFYANRLRRLLPSCIICGATKYLIFLAFESYLSVLKEGLHLGIWSILSLDLWYVHTIIIFYILSPVFYYLLLRWPKHIIFVVFTVFIINELTLMPIIGYNWFSPQGVLSWTIGRLPIFILGMVFSIKGIINRTNLYISFLLLISAICVKFYSKMDLSINPQIYVDILLILGMPALVLLNVKILAASPNTIKHLLEFFGSYSLELYLVHEFIFWSIKISYNNTSAAILLLISFLLTCISAFLCNKLSKKILHLWK